MPRPPLIIPRKKWTVNLPIDLQARVFADLWSAAEARVPYGALSAFFEKLVREHYARIDAKEPPDANP